MNLINESLIIMKLINSWSIWWLLKVLLMISSWWSVADAHNTMVPVFSGSGHRDRSPERHRGRASGATAEGRRSWALEFNEMFHHVFSHWDQQPKFTISKYQQEPWSSPCFQHVFSSEPWNSTLAACLGSPGSLVIAAALGSGTRNTRRAWSRCRSQGIDARRRSLGGVATDPKTFWHLSMSFIHDVSCHLSVHGK